MGKHLLAMVIIAASVVIGIIIAVGGSIKAGIIFAVVGSLLGFCLAAYNMWQVWKNPSKLAPKTWRL
jgi:hypothetical protein